MAKTLASRAPPMISSKLTSKAQTTIPQPVRAALHLEPGDELVYEITDGYVILTKARASGRTDDPFRTFHEWSTEADAKAYADL
ncbi:MAG: type II toxin-antitoxin system PrlF family antitoxin [Porticoccaceae bacterium]